jgi:hypothetical protein
MAFPTFTLVTCILVLILLITTTFMIIYLIERTKAFGFPGAFCLHWQCNGGFDPTAAFMAQVLACKPGADGKVNPATCSCSGSGWSAFYDPQNPNNYTGTPPSNPPANNCIN